MLIIIDANVLCSALLAKGRTADLLFSPRLDPIAPELLLTELERHKSELLKKSKLSEQDFNELIALFKKRVRIIPVEEFEECLLKANQLLKGHTKDTEYVALALKFNCPLWSKEKVLKTLPDIEVLDADDVVRLLSA